VSALLAEAGAPGEVQVLTCEVWAAAGHPAAAFLTTFHELLRLTGGTAAEVTS
jgi:hypothetical protein